MKKILAFVLAMCMLMSCAVLAEEADTQLISLTTGLPTDHEYKAMAVQFDNTPDARPQLNMSAADVIYELEIANGGYTRYTAIFNDKIPETVEAVRSARIMHADVSRDWSATFVHFGGQQMAGSSVYDYISKIGLDHFDGLSDSTNFYRDKNRVAPYNAVGKLKQMYDSTTAPDAESVHTPLAFSADNPTIKGDDVTTFRIPYNSSYTPSYEYLADQGVYRRYYNRKEMKDGATGDYYECANVIVMTADYSWYNGASDRPIVELLNTSNTCEYFIGGKHFTGTWSRGGVNESTMYFDEEGNIVNFATGKTFIQVVKPSVEIEIVE